MGRRDEISQFELDCSENAVNRIISSNIKKRMESRSNPKHRTITHEEMASEIRKMTGHSFERSAFTKRMNGQIRFSIVDLLNISEILHCSLDSLCRTKTYKRDNEAAERYTGLSQESIQYLHSLDKKKRAILDCLLNQDSGLDSILQDICDARAAARNAAFIEKHLQIVMLQYEDSSKGHDEIKRSYKADHTVEEEITHVPPAAEDQLNRQRLNILNRTDMLQLQEFRQENNKRSIRTMVERILSNLIPSAKSDLFPDLDKIREKYAGSGSNPFLR